jgi:hypothetical protein
MRKQDKRIESSAACLPLSQQGKRLPRETRKGLKRKYQALPAVKPRNWSGKPGFRRFAPEMRPKEEDANFYAFILHEEKGTARSSGIRLNSRGI